ncbi:MAG: hypothetical protein HC772_10975 [Leptolyngbyaceae cyanobacterium CRU_2_3]|nr:hypothetical protein [Leptolyngbyaceae cyanobacterium CRU_2_3]
MKSILLASLCLVLGGSPLLALTLNAALPIAVAQTPTYSDLVISLERTACFGTCPIYQLTVYGDGRVTYEGRAFVSVQGRQTAQISPAQVQQLVQAVEAAQFFSLADQYTTDATDLPGAWTSVTLNGQSKRIWHYGATGHSGLDNAPRSLTELEQAIDTIANSQQWVAK